ncbi:MAG: hypothetical protein E6R04_03980 [Spirochaetes bacterium]|nr:MAG: hypothetical protein E6R04_03980 [Spirochaetota bacterium]
MTSIRARIRSTFSVAPRKLATSLLPVALDELLKQLPRVLRFREVLWRWVDFTTDDLKESLLWEAHFQPSEALLIGKMQEFSLVALPQE